MYKKYLKRLFDVLLSLLLLLLLSPLILSVILVLLFANRGHVFFVQERPGMNGVIFKLIKFRTMNDKRDSNNELLPDEQRLTRCGKVIRKLSLDELPQLVNVLKGDMSLIGPRPLLVEYLPLYNEDQKKRHLVKPGITGWAQVNGRNLLSWPEKFKYDIDYVENISFLTDLKILFLTVMKVVRSENINSSNCATAEKFTGNQSL